MGKHEPVPPRIKIYTTVIESKQDIWLLVESYPAMGGGLPEFLEELMNQWKDYQDLILALVERDEAVETDSASEVNHNPNDTAKFPAKLRLVIDGSTAYWGSQFLPIKGKHFDILRKLIQRPGKIVGRQDLYSLIDSEYHKDALLRQYIKDIRNAFPAPYSDPHHPEGIIKTKKTEGYYLNLSPDQVEVN